MSLLSRLLCLLALWGGVAVPPGAVALGPVVRCEPCDAAAMSHCKPLPGDCAEHVREPGCGCCMTCALTDGQACGIYTGRCGSGLTCRHRAGDKRPLQALLEGRGVCGPATSRKLPVASPKQEAGQEPEEDLHANGTGSPEPEPVYRVPDHNRPPLPHPHSKGDVIRNYQNRKSHSYRVEFAPSGPTPDVQNFSLESKRETEYGPCRRQIDSMMNSLKVINVVNPRTVPLPNCDKKGFYKKKQCRPSKGKRRGYCWCVDKFGQPMPAYEEKEKGEIQCNNLESK